MYEFERTRSLPCCASPTSAGSSSPSPQRLVHGFGCTRTRTTRRGRDPRHGRAAAGLNPARFGLEMMSKIIRAIQPPHILGMEKGLPAPNPKLTQAQGLPSSSSSLPPSHALISASDSDPIGSGVEVARPCLRQSPSPSTTAWGKTQTPPQELQDPGFDLKITAAHLVPVHLTSSKVRGKAIFSLPRLGFVNPVTVC